MNVWKFVKLIKAKHVWSLSKLCLWHPLFVLPTILATKECVSLANKHYGKLHHKNNRTNAFRHAVWNYLIAYKCFKWRPDEQKVTAWAKKITDWHEGFSPNSKMAELMDLHNNSVGRAFFLANRELKKDAAIEQLVAMVDHSQKVATPEETVTFKEQMVHIVD